MGNPIFLSKKSGQPFVYYHTHSVSSDNLKAAIDSKKSIELDIAIDEDGVFYKKGTYYIGHPVTFYTEAREEEFHNNIDLEKALEILKNNKDIFVVLDCKNVKALPKMGEIVTILGKERCLFHAYAREWDFRPFATEDNYQLYWDDESMPLSKIIEFREKNNVPIIAACRGVSEKRLRDKDAVSKILEQAKGTSIDCISLFMYDQGIVLPPLDLARQISNSGFLTWINIDKIKGLDMTGINYIGMTDVLERASSFKS